MQFRIELKKNHKNQFLLFLKRWGLDSGFSYFNTRFILLISTKTIHSSERNTRIKPRTCTKTHWEAACHSTTDLLLTDPSCGALQKLNSSAGPTAFHQLLSTTRSQTAHFSLWNSVTLFLKRSQLQFSTGILNQQGSYSTLHNISKYMLVPVTPVPSKKDTDTQNDKSSPALFWQA